MIKTILGLLLFTVAMTAGAQAPAAAAPANAAASAETVTIAADQADLGKHDRRCIQETGTRIKRRDSKGCLAVNGSSYSREDLESTGSVNISDALQRLDPSITVHH